MKVSAQCQSNTIDGIEKAIKKLNGQLRSIEESIQASEEHMEAVDDKMEYLENTSRRNNIKVIVIEESPNIIESWDESETIVKDKIKSLLTGWVDRRNTTHVLMDRKSKLDLSQGSYPIRESKFPDYSLTFP